MSRQRKSAGRGKRSAGQYRHPVPGPDRLLALLTETDRPMALEDISAKLELTSAQHIAALKKRLAGMVSAGQIIRNRGGQYGLVKRMHLIAGIVTAHRDGYGFVTPDEGGTDIFLSAREMRPVFHGDHVAIRIRGHDSRGRPEGKLVEVLTRNTDEVAGQYATERGIGMVVPDNPRITRTVLVPRKKNGGARPGQMVVARIVDYPTATMQATGEVVSVLGQPGAPGMATELAIHAHGIPYEWPAGVRDAAAGFGTTVPTRAKRGREDLRALPLVTIDGADARDFDDAVCCERDGNGWRLRVAIADVAYYVRPGSAIDDEALKRGTSVYFPDRVVPMLPEVLSNGLCSLNPKVDRLCVVCDMRVTAGGRVRESRFYEAVMRSHARLTYDRVAAFLDGSTARIGSTAVRESLSNLQALYRAFARARRRRGALELDLPGVSIRLNDNGEVAGIVTYQRNDAHRLIEECMIAANVEAARFLKRYRLAGLYRVHDKPRADRFEAFRDYLLTLGFKVPLAGDAKPKDFAVLLDAIADRPDAYAISMALLRSLAHAEYTPDNVGHFGLALKEYAHFTSPIRRYPDLLVHRAVKHIAGGGKPGAFRYSHDDMQRLGLATSLSERRAEDATREVEGWLKCQYMQDKIGREYQGTVTSVVAFGLFVLIPELQVDGLVHVSNLRKDYFEYRPGEQSLVGSRSGRTYTLGDRVRIVVHDVDMDNRRIDFRLVRGDGR
ncbi:MAG: ribonuclease R [Pseudomonadota bacterium]